VAAQLASGPGALTGGGSGRRAGGRCPGRTCRSPSRHSCGPYGPYGTYGPYADELRKPHSPYCYRPYRYSSYRYSTYSYSTCSCSRSP
jgi:hypothetical protein